MFTIVLSINIYSCGRYNVTVIISLNMSEIYIFTVTVLLLCKTHSTVLYIQVQLRTDRAGSETQQEKDQKAICCHLRCTH